ncbi:bone morphogenetic protein receptor type-2-like isoform X1 [Sander lucioperca]|uniref:bone morphogenetic protein receptor type-2-like isoform X1 n=1 Tax=Sander lucioperca TaxID=283035 RepID=UPI00165362E7|nr:bone morphogenetic protein receptor type-2-like isoform X1 [Sander lucioperca]
MLQRAEPHSGTANELRGMVPENSTVRCNRRCFGLWEKKPDGGMHPVKQGCWTHVGNEQECHSDHCQVTATASLTLNDTDYHFCCCSRDLCNANFTEPPPTAETPALRLMKADGRDDRLTDPQPLRREETALIALVTVAIAAVAVVVLFLGYRMMKGKQKHSLSALDVMEAANTNTAVDLDHLKLLELIGRGRYGSVFRGCLNERCVAVKVFSSANRQNYANERSIYCVPLLQQHDNIARFLGADERLASDGRPEFLILMEFYPHGCLSRYLSLHTVDWSTCCRMTHGVTRGLAFLHTELYRGDQYKAAVAHRDVTSRNVLVRADLSCVLADFGLSMRLTGSLPCRPGDDETVAISEVGTVRYMAPEVLGGALNLRDCESALKQVDVYALGLLYWESFRRCSYLFPGEAVPEYQLAFQAELGNHPSFEEMQILVAREKFRPRFPESWKENSLALRSLKETMEDCWDQDAEARLTAQCAEQRLFELSLLSTHTAVHNHRNLSQGLWPPPSGSAPSLIKDLQVGVVKNLQGDGHPAAVVKMTTSGAEGPERNRNSINHERQQAQARLSTSDNNMLSSSAMTPVSTLLTISESQHTGGALPSVCQPLTEEDLETQKLDPKEVDKNLRGSSDENLMERSQKQFSSSNLLYGHVLQTAQVNYCVSVPQGELGGVGGVETTLPLPKLQNLPQRPTSLHLLHKTNETVSASSRLKLGKLKSNHRQVETGVAKMNTVAVATAAEPRQVTAVTINTSTRVGGGDPAVSRVHSKMAVASSYSAGAPALVTNSLIGRGRTNPAGPQLEDEDKMEAGEDQRINLLNASPDEHEPLLRREQPPAESHPGRGSNSNNNNNRTAWASGEERVRGSGSDPCVRRAPVSTHGSSTSPETRLVQTQKAPVLDPKALGPPVSGPNHPVSGPNPPVSGPVSGPSPPVSGPSPPVSGPNHPVSGPNPPVSGPNPPVSGPNPPVSGPNPPVSGPNHPVSDPNPPVSDPDPPVFESQKLHPTALPEPAAVLRRPAFDPQTPQNRRGRPCSLDLSASCTSSDDAPLTDDGGLSASGEKIKRRVKTPYTVKKWRPASWVVSTDTALDPDFEFNTAGGGSQTHFPSGFHGAGSFGIPKINQSKSSMAVFLVGGGATATATSDPDGITCF